MGCCGFDVLKVNSCPLSLFTRSLSPLSLSLSLSVMMRAHIRCNRQMKIQLALMNESVAHLSLNSNCSLFLFHLYYQNFVSSLSVHKLFSVYLSLSSLRSVSICLSLCLLELCLCLCVSLSCTQCMADSILILSPLFHLSLILPHMGFFYSAAMMCILRRKA